MSTKKEKGKDDLKEIILSDDSSLILPEVSFPSTYQAQSGVKYGAKSNEQKLASEHELLEYQRRITRRDSIPTNQEIKNLILESTERRRALQQSIAEQKAEFEQKHNLELQNKHIKQREEARQLRIKNENDTQRQKRLEAEEEVKTSRAREIQALENKCRKEKRKLMYSSSKVPIDLIQNMELLLREYQKIPESTD